MTRSRPLLLSAAAALLVLACAEQPEGEIAGEDAATETEAPTDEPAMDAAMDEPMGTVTIVEPADGAVVEGPDVTVRLGLEGMTLAQAGDTTPGTGHHHLFLDADISPFGQPIPVVEGEVIHMGDASTEYTLTGVEPGEHRLITVVGDGLHVPLEPLVVDTVVFTVR